MSKTENLEEPITIEVQDVTISQEDKEEICQKQSTAQL